MWFIRTRMWKTLSYLFSNVETSDQIYDQCHIFAFCLTGTLNYEQLWYSRSKEYAFCILFVWVLLIVLSYFPFPGSRNTSTPQRTSPAPVSWCPHTLLSLRRQLQPLLPASTSTTPHRSQPSTLTDTRPTRTRPRTGTPVQPRPSRTPSLSRRYLPQLRAISLTTSPRRYKNVCNSGGVTSRIDPGGSTL